MQEAGIFNVPFGKIAGGVVCAHCGRLLSDHAMTRLVLPFELGGDSSADNIVYLCEECDSSLSFTVNVNKAFPYISGKQCERIMDYMDTHLTKLGSDDMVCARCGKHVDTIHYRRIEGVMVPLCESCNESFIVTVFPYMSEETKTLLEADIFENSAAGEDFGWTDGDFDWDDDEEDIAQEPINTDSGEDDSWGAQFGESADDVISAKEGLSDEEQAKRKEALANMTFQ